MSSQSGSGDEEEPSAYRPFTKAEHIRQLNDIDKGIAQLVQNTAFAIKAISASHSEEFSTPSDRRKAFEHATESFLGTLHRVDVGIKRQISSLEEANIIRPETIRRTVEVDTKPVANPAVKMGTKPGGKSAPVKIIEEHGIAGNFDIGWLNSRSGRVGRDMEAELWDKTRVFLENLEKGKSDEDLEKDKSNCIAHREQDVDMT